MGIIETVHEHWMNEGRQEVLEQMREQFQREMQQMQRGFVTRMILADLPDAEVVYLSGTTAAFVQTVRAEMSQPHA